MRKVLLSLVVILLLVSCGGGLTETATETCAESYSEETSQLNKKYEKTYFDDVFELVSETDRGYLFLSKDMTWYDRSGGTMLLASYGTYTINNGIVTLKEEYSDVPDGGNSVYKYNIKYKGSDIFLGNDENEYKICNVENKEKIFGNLIELRRNNKGMQQQEKEYISGTWWRGIDPYFGTLSFSYNGTYEYNVGNYGKGGIKYYVKGNTVYVDVYDEGNYEALMQITSNGDIIFDGDTFKKQ